MDGPVMVHTNGAIVDEKGTASARRDLTSDARNKRESTKHHGNNVNEQRRQETNCSRPVSRSNSNSPETAEAESQKGADVGAVVTRAKRAASSLWLLVHAQNCRIGADDCPNKGCREAKTVLLHLKTCTARDLEPCPSNYNGCQQARKLLAHHRRCRDVRAKRGQQHFCLVCSLVARHARNLLEGGGRRRGPKAKVLSSFSLQQSRAAMKVPALDGTPGMPPPPPRREPGLSVRNKECVSPPSRNHLLQFSEVAAATALPSVTPSEDSPNGVMGRSLESSNSSFLTFAAGMLHQMKRAPPRPLTEPRTGQRRCRAESYDAATAALRMVSSPRPTPNHHPDPTFEIELRKDNPVVSPRGEVVSQETEFRTRPRSASLSVLATASAALAASPPTSPSCDTIQEESARRHADLQQPFLMEEDL